MTAAPMILPAGSNPPNRFSGAAVAITLLVALLACACGFAVAWRAPALPAPRRVATLPRRGTPAIVATSVPYGAAVTGTITGIDRHLGALRLRVGDESYVYYMSYRTEFPAPCLARANLRAGQAVRLILPWYLNGDVWIEAMLPPRGCGGPAAPQRVLSHTTDSPPGAGGAR